MQKHLDGRLTMMVMKDFSVAFYHLTSIFFSTTQLGHDERRRASSHQIVELGQQGGVAREEHQIFELVWAICWKPQDPGILGFHCN